MQSLNVEQANCVSGGVSGGVATTIAIIGAIGAAVTVLYGAVQGAYAFGRDLAENDNRLECRPSADK